MFSIDDSDLFAGGVVIFLSLEITWMKRMQKILIRGNYLKTSN